ncbi:MAG: prepilin-type N-terminal cleavage/methylation domain-containing protein [Planctomycetes bacterium]|nr:prepilin-type N-terminal cleavage/methylation domain-containing protein [Planctomycetota bacterium]
MTEHRRPFQRRAPASRRRGFTLVEVLVVTGISLILMTVGTAIYIHCLKLYRESQGLTTVFEMAKFINRDMRDYLSQIVPVRGSWVSPKTLHFPGSADATAPDGAAGYRPDTDLDPYYLDSQEVHPDFEPKKSAAMTRDSKYDLFFSGPQYPPAFRSSDPFDTTDDWKDTFGYPRYWYNGSNVYPGLRGWWMPAFYGHRDAAQTVSDPTSGKTLTIAEARNILAGSWGWPRPDYRLDADADKLAEGTATCTAAKGCGGNVACWFYAEDREFNSPRTLALDNANVVLMSIKFSRWVDEYSAENTQLSVLRHQIVGFDVATHGLLRADQAYGNMLRAIRLTPMTLDNSGMLATMTDADLGVRLDNTLQNGAGEGMKLPRAFDVVYTLRNPGSGKLHEFALRIVCQKNPQ